MKKSFYLSFASSKSINDVCKDFYDRFDIDFATHESNYIGEYLGYSGIYADAIKVLPNKMPDGQKMYGDTDEIKTIVEISIVSGKNSEKSSKYKFMKSSVRCMNGALIIKDEVIEEP